MVPRDVLERSKKEKNDEYYTLYESIEKELSRYKAYFRGKRVYCPCDDPSFSNFYRFFVDHFFDYGLKEVVFTWLGGSEFYKLIRRGNTLYNEYGLTFNSGDFAENGYFFRACDIVVTNPPFSLWRKFFDMIMKYKKDFLVVGSLNCLKYKNVFPYVKSGKVRVGYNSILNYLNGNKNSDRYGTVTKISNGIWLTTLPVTERRAIPFNNRGKALLLYDNYDAVNVDNIVDIPPDYDGIMGVPVTIFTYDIRNYDVLGLTAAFSAGKDALVNGKKLFTRVFIRKKKSSYIV